VLMLLSIHTPPRPRRQKRTTRLAVGLLARPIRNQIAQKKKGNVGVKNQLQKSGRGAAKRPRRNVLADTQPAALKYPEACRYLGGIHEATLRRMVERGLIRPNKMLRHVLFPVAELNRVLQEGMLE
jgi:hypothetical protein